MQSIEGGETESPRGSIGSETGFGAGSDIEYVARDIGEDLKVALDEFQLDKDGLDKLDSDVEDCESQGSNCPPSRAESDTEIYSECDKFIGAGLLRYRNWRARLQQLIQQNRHQHYMCIELRMSYLRSYLTRWCAPEGTFTLQYVETICSTFVYLISH
jgi:hypothetical protein